MADLAFLSCLNTHPTSPGGGVAAYLGKKEGSIGRALMIGALLALPQMAGAQPIAPARQAELEHIVTQDCGSCHGLRLTGGLGRAITPDDLEGRDPEVLALLILDGVPGTAMPPWRPLLTEAEARWIADYLLKDKTP
ncbi:cytochrome c [Paracoccus sp. p4-l81]|uniref:c-type cytochrome n=1 Tax=unclassified Paracoccus (in: a-proteobacteria) TaxID=2688777 RepID=UPI0035B72D07